MLIHLLILNYNGRSLLAECLPSIVRATEASRHRCDLVVIDNDSTDDSVEWLADHFPAVRVVQCENRGLCSYNEVVASLPGRIAVLLNNDVKLDKHCLDPLIRPLLAERSDCFMTAPRCFGFDETSYEGFRTAVLWRWGLIQATALFRGHKSGIDHPGPTASSGAVMAIDCPKFLELGGFDPLYLPGRLEDLDLAFRAFMQGYCACYVPESLAWHRGMASFGKCFGRAGCDRLALRNTLLFEWKNIRHPAHLARIGLGLGVRWALEVAQVPWQLPERRWTLTSALAGAVTQLFRTPRTQEGHGELPEPPNRPFAQRVSQMRREREFFRQFCPAKMIADSTSTGHEPTASGPLPTNGTNVDTSTEDRLLAERSRKVCRLP